MSVCLGAMWCPAVMPVISFEKWRARLDALRSLAASCLLPCVIGLVAFVAYWPSLHGDFVYDDRPAILDNKDVSGQSGWLDIFRNDYWGTPIHSVCSPFLSFLFFLTPFCLITSSSSHLCSRSRADLSDTKPGRRERLTAMSVTPI